MARKKYMFTNKNQSRRGMASSVLGCFALVSVALALYFSYKNGDAQSARYGLGALLSFVFSVIGFSLGAKACSERDVFMLFPVFGFISNLCAVLISFVILFVGVYGL